MNSKDYSATVGSICVGIAVLIVLWACGAQILKALDLPTVYWSQSENDCVRVETPQGPGSCDALPDKYSFVWVQ